MVLSVSCHKTAVQFNVGTIRRTAPLGGTISLARDILRIEKHIHNPHLFFENTRSDCMLRAHFEPALYLGLRWPKHPLETCRLTISGDPLSKSKNKRPLVFSLKTESIYKQQKMKKANLVPCFFDKSMLFSVFIDNRGLKSLAISR